MKRERRSQTVFYPEFREDAAEMSLDGLLADAELHGNILVADAFRETREYLTFTSRQCSRGEAGERPLCLQLKHIEYFPRQAGIDPHAARGHRADRVGN